MGIALFASTASADPRCTVAFRSANDDGASWRDAVSNVEREIAKRPDAETDCRQVLVVVDERGAVVTFVTRDERSALRRISRPSDLRPLIEALLVTIPEASGPPTAAAADEPASAVPIDLAPLDTPMAPAPAERPRAKLEDRAGPIVAIGAGLTVGAGEPGTIGQVEVGYLTRGWELGLVGRLEPEHEGPGTSAHANLSAAGASLLAAHRAALGPVTLLFGGALGVFSVSSKGRRESAPFEEQRHKDDLADVRAGAMLGCLAAPIGPVRFRGQVDAQLGLFEQTPKYADLPPNPRFTLALTLGAETNLLP